MQLLLLAELISSWSAHDPKMTPINERREYVGALNIVETTNGNDIIVRLAF